MFVQRHSIGRQTIEIVLPGKDDLPSLRQRIGEIYRTLLLPQMDIIFSDFSGPDAVTRFERIELDLGIIAFSDLEAALCDNLGSSLRAELQRRTGPAIAISQEEQSRFPGVQERGTPLPDVPRFIDEQALRRELLLHFLDTGTLPWWAEDKSSWTGESILLQLIDRSPDEASSVLQETISRDARRTRLISQMPDEILGRIAVTLGAPEGEIRTWMAQLPLFPGLSDDLFMPVHLVRIAFWEAVLTAMLPPGPVSLTGEDCIERLLRTLARVSGRSQDELVRRFQHALRGHSLSGSGLQGLLNRSDADFATDDQPGKNSRGSVPSGEDTTGVMEEQAVVQQGGSDASSVVPGGDTEDLCRAREEESRYFVENAGLVILWPYLGSFFDRCRLLRDGVFSDELSAMQTVSLLQHLVNGEQGSGEQHLTLNKVLCGWPLNRPLCRFLPFPEGAVEESERLLQSVIGHWAILKNTSPQGLRESFLQRKGILCDEAASWVLQVERRSYDVLLDYLPWGITMVRLSWMTKPLIVQW